MQFNTRLGELRKLSLNMVGYKLLPGIKIQRSHIHNNQVKIITTIYKYTIKTENLSFYNEKI